MISPLSGLPAFDDAEIIEIVLHVGLNTLISYVNKVGDTDLDFPLVKTRKAY